MELILHLYNYDDSDVMHFKYF